MHELSIARSILDTMTSIAELAPGEHYSAVTLRIGEVSGVEPEALRFGLEALAQDRGWRPLDLRIERTLWRRRCDACRCEFAVNRHGARCPQCGETGAALAGGDELEIVSVEVESLE